MQIERIAKIPPVNPGDFDAPVVKGTHSHEIISEPAGKEPEVVPETGKTILDDRI